MSMTLDEMIKETDALRKQLDKATSREELLSIKYAMLNILAERMDLIADLTHTQCLIIFHNSEHTTKHCMNCSMDFVLKNLATIMVNTSREYGISLTKMRHRLNRFITNELNKTKEDA